MTAAAPRILSPAARYAAACRAESAQVVAAGRRPKDRMAAPSVPNAGEPLFVTNDTKGNLFSQGSTTSKLDGRVLLDLLPARAVVFVDRRAARAAVRAVERSGVEGSSRLAEAVGYLAKLPGTSTAVVLADALAAKFWCPDGSNPQHIDAWLRTFDLKTGDSAAAPDFYRHLYQLVSDPKAETATQRAWASRLRSDASLLQALSNRQPSGSIKAFNSIISRQEVWSAIERIDPLLREIAALTGEVVEVSPNRLLGGIIEATASTPFKLRPGRVAIFDDKDLGAAKLLELGYRDGLVARFSTKYQDNTSTSRTTANHLQQGVRLLQAAHHHNTTVWATAEPYLGRSSDGFAGPWAGRRNGGSGSGVSGRDVPLYVSLAGADTA
jgi:hypothetical protein